MISAGFTLAVVGMAVVFVFLVLLVFVIQLSSRLLAAQTAVEFAGIGEEAARAAAPGAADRARVVAAISAAVAAFRATRK